MGIKNVETDLWDYDHHVNPEMFVQADHTYVFYVTGQGISFVVNADNESDALDEVIDYCSEHVPGLIIPMDEEEEYGDALEDYPCGGNAGHYLNTVNVSIVTIW